MGNNICSNIDKSQNHHVELKKKASRGKEHLISFHGYEVPEQE